MSNSLSTHVLDLQTGKPATDLFVSVYAADSNDLLCEGTTDADGRVTVWSQELQLEPGEYLIKFHVKDWFDKTNSKTLYPVISITFQVADAGHYHIPLLLSPFGYSTYRGS